MTGNRTDLHPLPLELLTHVVDQLACSRSELEFQFVTHRQEKDDIIRQTTCDLRLANRTLCQAVSHAFIPGLGIRLSLSELTDNFWQNKICTHADTEAASVSKRDEGKDSPFVIGGGKCIQYPGRLDTCTIPVAATPEPKLGMYLCG